MQSPFHEQTPPNCVQDFNLEAGREIDMIVGVSLNDHFDNSVSCEESFSEHQEDKTLGFKRVQSSDMLISATANMVMLPMQVNNFFAGQDPTD